MCRPRHYLLCLVVSDGRYWWHNHSVSIAHSFSWIEVGYRTTDVDWQGHLLFSKWRSTIKRETSLSEAVEAFYSTTGTWYHWYIGLYLHSRNSDLTVFRKSVCSGHQQYSCLEQEFIYLISTQCPNQETKGKWYRWTLVPFLMTSCKETKMMKLRCSAISIYSFWGFWWWCLCISIYI